MKTTDKEKIEVDPESLPLIDPNELDDQHHKAYLSNSMKAAVRKFASIKGVTESEATRQMILASFESPRIFGGYRLTVPGTPKGYVVMRGLLLPNGH